MACSVSAVVKYLLFGFNFLFWLIGGILIGVGGWAYYEKNQFYHTSTSSIYDIIFDVSLILIFVGIAIFTITFFGCLGALRENICLLKIFAISLGIVFLIELVGALLAFIFSSQVKQQLTEIIREEGLIRYRDDADLQSLMDWFQETFGCCGVGDAGYQDWSLNVYFNCSPANPSVERCAVPFSCCLNQNNLDSNIVNLMCGYGAQLYSVLEAAEVIYTDGCVDQVMDAVRGNLLLVGGVAIGVAVMQFIMIMSACHFYKELSLYQLRKGYRKGQRASFD